MFAITRYNSINFKKILTSKQKSKIISFFQMEDMNFILITDVTLFIYYLLFFP